MCLIIEPIPAFEDNYIWLLYRPDGASCAVVDPGAAEPVIARLQRDGRRLDAILITHHHADHIGGLAELRRRWPQAEVFGPEDRRIPGLTRVLADGDRVPLAGLECEFEVMAVPGHTATHIAYRGKDRLFCGDTLFAAGCGRVFDGTFEQLAASLQRIAELPASTRCYCAHEYTLANLGFARWVEPDSPAVAAAITAAEQRRAQGQPTVPTTLAEEFAVNPFLRTAEPAVIAAAERFAGRPLEGQTQVFMALRRWKDERYD
ncbi:hydroxyacylglutathione hydrolase [Halochromatium salexigens]|uniref:Hydroxyacylglutathione hydrolase n=1 Tax=Halochromatium salexigens TaxID=49447 RepID=A0AAJ0UGT8_HALSE|nr:hydroxyacylglutathione hydrolase [Halochromatium salexigens]MBK5931197.1 hydroxyacylglutathione hydrolase [Halochromatium salexigens]